MMMATATMKVSESRAAFVKDWLNTVEGDIKAVREAQSNLIAREKSRGNYR